MLLGPGTRLGPYEVIGPLGAGGMGEVYRARDTRLRRDVAVKVLPDALASDGERLHRFEQEALAASALNHPNVLTIHDIGSEAGRPFVVFELLEGQTLREELRGSALPVRRTIELLSDRSTELGPYLSARRLDAQQTEALRAVVEQRLALGRLEGEVASLRDRLADGGARSAELRETLNSLGRTGAAAAGLRRQVLDRLRDATEASERLAAELAGKTLELAEARARFEETLAALAIRAPDQR